MSVTKEIKSDLKEAMDWRYAVKAFDPDKKLSEDQINGLLEVVRMAPTAYGQQPFKVLNIQDADTRKKLLSASYGQEKVVNASHLLVFAIDTELSDKTVQAYLKLTSEARNIPVSAVEQFGGMIKNVYNALGEEGRKTWAEKQAYLGLGFLLTAAAVQGIDACPMEGFDPAQYDEILGLSAKGLKTSVIVTLGVRSENDKAQHLAKVRKSMDQLVEVI